MKNFFCIIILLLSLLAELLIGNSGFSFSLTTGVLLYAAGTYGVKTALYSAVFAGLFLDMSYSRPEAFSAVILPAAVAAGCYFMPSKEYRWQLFRSLPAGTVAGCISAVGSMSAVSLLYGKSGHPGIAATTVGALFFGLCIFPSQILLFDFIAGKLDLPGYLTKLPADMDRLENPEIEIETASGRRRRK